MPKLRPYQLEAVKDILDKKKMLIADDMGLGKCAESIAAKTAIEQRQDYDSRALIVCPNSVMQHWEDEIKTWYKKGDNTRVTQIQTPTFDQDVEKAKYSDFAILAYPTLSYLGNRESSIDRLANAGFNYGIVDEAHNAKNPSSIRSMAVKKVFDSMDYLAILSGTPIPNTVADIYLLLSLLDKDKFPLTSENPNVLLTSFYSIFRRDPEFVRRVLNDRMLRRTIDDYLHKSVPSAHQNVVEVPLTGDHKEAYQDIYFNDSISPSSKLIQLRKAALDPNLVDASIFTNQDLVPGKMNSNLYEALDSIVEESVRANGKVLMFSDLKKGVTDKLQRRYQKYGALVIDGDVSSLQEGEEISVREEIRQKFQRDSNNKVLIATTVMDEGVDLTAATDVVHLTLPYTPAAVDQRNRRSQRIGEVAKDHVNIHVLKAKIDDYVPTITEGIERLLEDKRRIVNYIMTQPFSLTKEDLEEIKNGKPDKSKTLVTLIKSPIQSIMAHFAQLKGQGSTKIGDHYEKYPVEAQNIAKLYAAHWDGFYGGNTGNFVGKVVRALEKGESLERKLDIASGPFSLSRGIRGPVDNIDINPYMIEAGRMLERDGIVVPGNKAQIGSFTALPYDPESFDLANLALALHMARPEVRQGKKKVSERELALREMNKVLRPEGYGLITIPHSLIDQGDLSRFYEGIEQLGFRISENSGFYQGPIDSKYKVYLGLFQKQGEPTTENLDPKIFMWKMDKKRQEKKSSSRRTKKHAIPEPKHIKRENVHEFYSVRDNAKVEEIF